MASTTVTRTSHAPLTRRTSRECSTIAGTSSNGCTCVNTSSCDFVPADVSCHHPLTWPSRSCCASNCDHCEQANEQRPARLVAKAFAANQVTRAPRASSGIGSIVGGMDDRVHRELASRHRKREREGTLQIDHSISFRRQDSERWTDTPIHTAAESLVSPSEVCLSRTKRSLSHGINRKIV